LTTHKSNHERVNLEPIWMLDFPWLENDQCWCKMFPPLTQRIVRAIEAHAMNFGPTLGAGTFFVGFKRRRD
jgi:hypothetical protein